MPRENSKCRKWEQERRGRINDCFARLGKLLPCYDPSSKLSKIEILTKAAAYVEELEGKVKKFLLTESETNVEAKEKAADGEFRQLYGRIKRLLSRNEQLSRLLRDAGISVPKECGGVKLACKAKKWSQKIAPEKAEVMRKMEEQKENEPKKAKARGTPKKKFLPKSKAPTKLKFTKKSPGKILKNGNANVVRALPSNVVAVTNVLTQPYYFITNGVSNNVTTKASPVNPSVIATAAVQKSVAVVTKPSAFPTGTIILPVIQQPALLNPPIILNPPPTNTLIVVNKTTTAAAAATVEPTKSDAITVPSKTTAPVVLPPIQPKQRSITMTTHINKVPIPASRYASNYILVSNIPMPTVQPKKLLLRKTRSKVKRKLPQKPAVEPKKCKTDEPPSEKLVEVTEQPKPPTSDYSINSICKEKETADKEKVAAVEENVPDKTEKSSKTPPHSELSNDIFATLQVPTGSQNPESTSPTAAFLNAFPLVSSFTGVKVAEVMEEETSDSRHETPTLLQIGTMDTSKPSQTLTDSLTPSLLNLDNFAFFSTKDLYANFDSVVTTTVTTVATTSTTTVATSKCEEKVPKILYDTSKVVKTATTTTTTAAKTSVCYSYSQSYYSSNCAVDVKTKPSCSRYNIPEYNTFNPFTDLPKTTAPCTYSTTKSYNQTSYANNCGGYNYQPDFTTSYAGYDNANQYNYCAPPPIRSTTKAKTNAPVNWMTDLPNKPDFVVPPFGKENEPVYSQNAFVSAPTTTYFNSDYTFQEDHQFGWSPTKLPPPQLLEPPHGLASTSTLPTLVGDLALNNSTTQYATTDRSGRTRGRERRGQQGYDATSNFLSVSQLVEQGRAGRVAGRRNSGGRSKAAKGGRRTGRSDGKEAPGSPKQQRAFAADATNDWQRGKNLPSSYSAEALIGKRAQQQNYSKNLPVPSFLPDNLITYFPPVDIPQDNAFGQQNQNYQNNTFAPPTFPSSMQNNSTFIPNPTTAYLPSTNFIPEIADYNPNDNIFSHSKPAKPPPAPPPPNKQNFGNATPKKSKKKPATDNAPFVDFSFLSMPAAINSPILPDDFHAHTNFLPPPPAPPPNQLYPCKNPLYPKQGGELGGSLLPPLPPVSRSNMHTSEISPSLNTVGTSLTNFNLSTIFPEINKSAVTDMYLDSSKTKDFGIQRSYLPSSTQIPPFTKAPIYSSIAPQSFSNS